MGLPGEIKVVKSNVDSKGARGRREYRGGNKKHPTFNTAYVTQWKTDFRTFSVNGTLGNPGKCDAIIAKYEARVLEYGYSLKDIDYRGPSKFDPFRIGAGHASHE